MSLDGYAQSVIEEMRRFFPAELFPEQDQQLFSSFMVPFMEYRVRLKSPTRPGKELLREIYWTVLPGHPVRERRERG
jgi:hypothetical protein